MTDRRFQDKVVLVTGTSRNTGVGIAALFLREGAKVFICSSTAASTAKGAALLRGMGLDGFIQVPADIGDGITMATVGGQAVMVRAEAITWCAGADGGLGDCGTAATTKSTANGRTISNGDNVYSWQRAQEAK